jgi:hypothetical protein
LYINRADSAIVGHVTCGLAAMYARSSGIAAWVSVAPGTQAEELKLVTDDFVAIPGGDLRFQFGWKALRQLDDAAALGANQVMMVALITLSHQFVALNAIPKITAFDQAHSFQQANGPIDGGQVTTPAGQGSKDFLDRKRMLLEAEQLQDRLALPGHFARFLSKPVPHSRQRPASRRPIVNPVVHV